MIPTWGPSSCYSGDSHSCGPIRAFLFTELAPGMEWKENNGVSWVSLTPHVLSMWQGWIFPLHSDLRLLKLLIGKLDIPRVSVSKDPVDTAVHQQHMKISVSPYPSQQILSSVFLILAILELVWFYKIVLFIYVFLISTEVQTFFLCFLTIHILSFGKSIQICAHL